MAERNLVLQLLITAKDQASGIVSGFVSSAKTQFAALTASIGAAFSFREAAIFEKALDAIRARADETGPALDTLIQRARDAAQTLGPQFGFSATAAAGGIKELIAAGFSANEAISALNGTLALAAMEEISVAKAATLISDAIAQFGLKAEDASRVADILAKSAGAVAATAVEMAEALKYTGNEASRSGMSLTETSAVLDVLAKAGQRGSEAGTGLASVLSILNNPAHAATKSLFDLGATSTELSSVLDFLQQRGLNASQTIALFGEQGARVINTLLAQGGSKAIADFADQIGKAGKSAEETAKIMQGNFLGALDRFWESLKRVGVELATPKLEPFAKGLDTLTDALNTFASNSRIQSFQKAIADGFSAAYEKARAFTGRIDWSGISTAIGNAFSTIGSAVGKAGEALGSIYSSLTGTLPGAASIAQQASDGLKAAWGGLGALAEGVASGIERIAQALGGSVAPSAQQTQTAMDGVTESAQKQATGFQALWQALKTDALQGLKATWDSLTRGAGDLLSAVNSLAQKGSEVLAGFIRNADFGPLRDLFNAVADSVKRLTGTMTEGFPNAQSAAATFANSFTIAWSGVTGILSAVISGTIKVVEAIGRATFEVGKYFDRYSDEEIQRIEANLNGLSTSAGEFAGVAARSFEASGKALDRMKGNAAAAEQQQQRLTQAAASGVTAQDALAGATAKQASSQQAAQEKVMLLAEGIKRQQAEVTRLAEADQSSVAAKNAHAAATQKLWGMQEDYTSALIAANSAATGSAQSQEQLDTALVNAGLALAQYVPSLDDLRQKMEQTRQQYEAVRKAQENKTLADTAEKSATEQINEARKAAADALGVYNNALEKNIDQSKGVAETAARVRQANQDVAQSNNAVTEASIKLAAALGDENRVAELVAQQKTALVAETRKVAESYQTEAAAAQKTADALQLRYEALVKSDPTNKQAIQQAKEAAAQAQAEAIAVRASAVEIAAKIPVQEQEARQAERMAGPIGQLIRLYDQKVAAAERETDAVERGYESKLRDLEIEQKQAEAKGDTARAAEIGIKIKEVEAEKAQEVANVKKEELQADIDLLEAKKLDVLASEKSAQAKAEELAQIDAKIAKLKDLKDAEQDQADKAKAEVEKAKRNAEALKAQAAAAAEAERETRRMAAVVGYAAQNFGQLSEKGRAAMAAIKSDPLVRAAQDADSLTRATAQLTKALDDQAGSEIRFARRLSELQTAAAGVGPAAERARQQLVGMAQSGTAGISGITSAGQSAIQTLEGIRNAALEAEQALAQMSDDYQRQILQAQGDQRQLLALEHEDNLKRLEELHQQAGQLGGDEYAQAKARADALHSLKLRQLAAEEAAKRRQEAESRTPQSTGGGTGTGAAGGGTTSVTNNFYVDPTKLANEEWVRQNVIPTVDKVARLRR